MMTVEMTLIDGGPQFAVLTERLKSFIMYGQIEAFVMYRLTESGCIAQVYVMRQL